MTTDFPGIPDYQHGLAQALSNSAQLLHDQGKAGEALRLRHRAIGSAQRALQANPHNVDYRWTLANAHRNLGETLLALGQYSEAAKAALEMPPINPQGWNAHYLPAQVLAGCVPLAEKDSRLPESERRAVAKSYADQAITLLNEAIHEGFADPKRLKEDCRLEPLRTRKDFQRLVRDLEEKAK